MSTNEIEILLKKYLDAETTLKEEYVLCEYFNNNDVEPHLQVYKSMFVYFNEAKLETSSNTFTIPNKKRKLGWMRIAASVILIIGLYTGYESKQKYDANLAMTKTQSAFRLLSDNMTRGNSSIAYLNEYESTKNKIFK
tara:strand:- start:818 stop:1231 length:414 start_codon:yes stop_codon:yes gene_type:complete